jgi:WhiB family transcriptional regulator, redox-sensing transcriptional regulator
MTEIEKLYAWHERAACATLPSDWWIPYKGMGRGHPHAVETCRTCPVRLECITWALEHNEPDGVWAGYSASYIKRSMRQRHCPFCHQLIPFADVAALVAADVEKSRWCCSACRERKALELAS